MIFWIESLISFQQDLRQVQLGFGEENLHQNNVLWVYSTRIEIMVNIQWKRIKYSDYICFYGYINSLAWKICYLAY